MSFLKKTNAIILGKNINDRHSILSYFSNSTVFVCTKLGWRISHYVITLPFCT